MKTIKEKPPAGPPRLPEKLPRQLQRLSALKPIVSPEQTEAVEGTPDAAAVDQAEQGAKRAGGSIARRSERYGREQAGKLGKKAVKRIEERKVEQARARPAEPQSTSFHRGTKSEPAPTPQEAAKKLTERRFRQSRQAQQTVRRAGKGVRDGARSTDRAARSIKTAGKTVKTAERTGRAAAKGAKTAIKTTERAAKAAVQTSARMAQAAKAAAKAAATAVKLTVKAIIAAVKAAAAAIKALVEIIAAGGWVVVVVILVVAVLAIILCSPFGIFAGGDGHTTTAEVIAQIEQEKAARIEEIQEEAENYDSVELVYYGSEDGGKIDNWTDILAVYAARVGLDPQDNAGALSWDEDHIDELRSVYWDMTAISWGIAARTYADGEGGTFTVRVLSIRIECKSYSDMPDNYHFSAEQWEILAELMSPEYTYLWDDVLRHTPELPDIDVELPPGLSADRAAVIEAALSIQGRVHYFWGGKSTVLGWDERWGEPAEVTAPGTDDFGKILPFGLDCSGFTAWAFINGAQDKRAGDALGYNTTEQWRQSRELSWSSAELGDLVFFAPPGERAYNHVGIIVGEDGGDYLVAHCASGQNNVVVTHARPTGFRYARRPAIYD